MSTLSLRTSGRLLTVCGVMVLGLVTSSDVTHSAPPPCVVTRSCVNFSFGINSIQATADGFIAEVGGSPIVYSVYACIGGEPLSTTCSSSLWNDPTRYKFLRMCPTEDCTVTYTGLRSGRTYHPNLVGVRGLEVAADEVGTISTWPLPPFTPTVSNIGQSSATVSWPTSFNGSTVVRHSPSPANWQVEPLNTPQIGGLQSVTATSKGTAWAVGYQGRIYHHLAEDDPANDGSDTWISQNSTTTNFLSGVDAFDENNVWVSGFVGTVLRTVNGGGSWTSANPPTNTFFYAVAATGANTAWVVGDNRTIYYFNGSTWQDRSATLGTNFYAVSSLNDKFVWAGGENGTIIFSSNGGQTWSTVATGMTSTVTSLFTNDGTTVWAGLANGTILHISGSAVVTTITVPTARGAYNLQVVSDNNIWFNNETSIGHLTQPGNVFNFDSQPSINMGSFIIGFALAHNSMSFAVGEQSIIPGYKLRGAISNTVTSVTSHTIQLNGLSPSQPYYFSAESYGSGVGAGALGTFTTISPDTIPPTINFTNPSVPGITYTNLSPFSVTGNAADTPPGTVQSVTLTSNGTPQTVSGVTSWSSTVTLQAGLNALVATATDGGSNTATASRTLFYDAVKPTVSITAPTNGSTVNITPVTVTGSAADTDQVAKIEISVNGGPRQDLGATPGASVSWSGSANLTVGSNTITAYATDRAGNEQSTQVAVTYAAPNFTLTAAPASQTGFVGDVKTYTVTLTSVNSFSGAVNLTSSSIPLGPSFSFSPASVSLTSGGTATSTMTVNTASATGNTYTLTITGTGGSITKTANVQLILNAAPDFTLSATPSPLNIVAGQSSSYQVVVSANNTFAGPVSFSLTGLPASTTGNFVPASVTLANSQTNSGIALNIGTQVSTPNGDYTLSITGTGTNTANGAVIPHTTTVILHISPAPDFSLSFQPASQNINAGGAPISFNGTITSLNGFNGTVALAVVSAPSNAGILLTLAPNQLTLTSGQTQNAALNVTTANSVPGGTYVLTITASSGSVVKSTTVNVVVIEDTTPPVITNIVATPNYNNVRISWTTDEPATSSVSIYTNPGQVGLVGTVSDAVTCTSGCHNVLYQPLNPLTTYYFSVSSTDIAPTAHTTTVVTDPAGNALQFTTLDEPDLIPPAVTLDQPADSTPPSEIVGTISVSGGATDNKNVVFVHLTITNQTPGPTENPIDISLACTGLTCAYTYSWNTMVAGAPGNGIHTVTVVAQDAAGNLSTPVTHTVNVNNDFTIPLMTSGPDASNLQCTPGTSGVCSIVITWSTNNPTTSEVGYQPSEPSFCDPITTVCVYTAYQRYDDAAPADASPAYTAHRVTLTGLEKNALYHYGVFSCNRSGLCLQGAAPIL